MDYNSRSDGGRSPSGALETQADAFLSELRALGHAGSWRFAPTCRTVAAFVRWLVDAGVSPADVSDAHVVEHLARATPVAQASASRRRAALDQFLRHLQRAGIASAPPPPIDATAAGILERRYTEYLRRERGLAERSVAVYLPYVRQFLADPVARGGTHSPSALDAEGVRAYFLGRAHGRSTASTHVTAAALRSFLRFLLLRAATATDLSRAIPTIRRSRLAGVPAYLSPSEVARVLRVADRDTPRGRRDYAILLLLARLGLRGGEVASLDLGDIHWREARLLVRRKGRILHDLPLPLDVGRTLARYVQRDRGPSPSRRVFLRRLPPHVGLSGPATIGHVVRRALVRAGLHNPSRRGASHLFRHGLATRMIRRGATIPEIAEILGHRSLGVTEIYAKVDLESLRRVARAWPLGSAR